jgi:hypothetical protein
MPRIRKYHNGGKGPGHPHADKVATRQDSLDLYNSSVDLEKALRAAGYTPKNRKYIAPETRFKVEGDKFLTKSEEAKLIEQHYKIKPLKDAAFKKRDYFVDTIHTAAPEPNNETIAAAYEAYYNSEEYKKYIVIHEKQQSYKDGLKEKYNTSDLPWVREGKGVTLDQRRGEWEGDVYKAPDDTSILASIPVWDYSSDELVYHSNLVDYQEHQDIRSANDPENVQREDLNEYQYLQRESANKVINEELPKGMYDTRIDPRGSMTWEKDIGNWYGGSNIDLVDFPNYANIHNKPMDLLTPEEKEKRKRIEGEREGGKVSEEERAEMERLDQEEEKEGYKKIVKYLFPAGKREQEPLLELLKPRITTVDRGSKGLQESNISLPKGRKTELIMKSNPNMRTGQEPNYYKVWNEKSKSWKRRDVEPEELDYYRKENRIRKPNQKFTFNKGGVLKGLVKKYHKGGKAGHTTHPNNLAYADHEPYDVVEGVETPIVADPALAALIAQRKLDAEESARKHGTITQGYQDIPPNAMWMYNAMNNMPPAIAERYRSENPGTSPEGINMWGLLGAAGYKGLGITIPGTKHIMGGVTLGDALNAYFLKEGVEGGIKHIPEFMEDPSLEGARNIAWDAIYALPGIAALKRNVLSPFLKGFKNARATASTGKAQNMVWDATTKSYVPEGELSGALQQLTGEQQLALPKGKTPKVKKKKSETEYPYEESNVAVSVDNPIKSKILVDTREVIELLPRTNSLGQGFGIEYPWHKDVVSTEVLNDQIAFIKREMGIIEARTSLIEQQNHTEYNFYKEALSKANEIKQLAGEPRAVISQNQGIYQYPSFMEGSKLSNQVSPKDGTISRAVLEQHANNPKTIATEAAALKEILTEFEGKRIPWVNIRQSLALDIRPAEIIKTDQVSGGMNLSLEKLGYNKGDVQTSTNLFKDPNLPNTGNSATTGNHFSINNSWWNRSLVTNAEPDVYHLLEIQTDVAKLKDPSKGLPGSEEAVDYYPGILSSMSDRFDIMSLDDQIKLFKNEIADLKADNEDFRKTYKSSRIGYDDQLAKMEKGLEIALGARKEVTGLAKATAKGLPLKMIQESLLDAARGGQTKFRFPTVGTLYKIEGWDRPFEGQLNAAEFGMSQIVQRYEKVGGGEGMTSGQFFPTPKNVGFIDDAVNELKKGYDKLRAGIRRGKPRNLDSWLFYNIQLSHSGAPPERIRTLIDQWHTFVEKEELLFKIKNSSITTDKQKNHAIEVVANLKKDFLKNLADAEELTMKAAELDKSAFEQHQNILKRLEGEEITVSSMKAADQEDMISASRDYRNFPKLWKKEFGTDLKTVTDGKGNTWYEVDIPEKFFMNDPSKPPSELKHYDKGGILQSMVKRRFKRGGNVALKGLMKKYGAGGSVSGWGAQGNFTTEYTSRQPEVEELPNPNALLTETIAQQPLEEPAVQADGLETAGMGGYDEVIMGSKSDQAANKIVDAIPVAGMFKKVGEFGSNLIVGDSTGEERKKKQKLAALLFSPHKLLAMRKADKSGDFGTAEADAKAEEERLAELAQKRAEDAALKKKNAFWAADGTKIPEKKPDVKDLIYQLESYGKETRNPKELWELMDSLRRKPHGSWNMPPDEEGWVPRHDDIYKYLASRGIDIKDDEIAKAYIMPGSVAGAGFVDGYDASAYSEKGKYVDPTKPSDPDLMNAGEFGAPPFTNARGQRIMLASTQLKNPTTRIEEAIHSLQQQRFLDPSVSDSKIGGNKRRLYRMLKKQPWLKELSPDIEKTITKGNYALKGRGSTAEFEAKLIASKMAMIQEGVLPKDGKVSDKDLEAIKQWYENYQNKTGETLWESVLFQDFSDKEYRDEILKTLNKL